MNFLEAAPEMKKAAQELSRLRNAAPRGQPTLVMRERPENNPRPTFRHNRGEYLQPQEQVAPGVPRPARQLPAGAPANRLSFAQWLVSPQIRSLRG